MVQDKIKEYLYAKGFRQIGVNISGIYLYCNANNQGVYIVALYECLKGNEINVLQYQNIKRQFLEKFADKYHEKINLLNIILTNEVAKIKDFIDNDGNQWVIDLQSLRVIIYENQMSNFLDIRNGLEDILYTKSKEMNNTNETNEEFTNYGRMDGTSTYTTTHTEYNSGEFRQKNSKPFLSNYITKCNTIIILINILVFFIVNNFNKTMNSYYLLDTGALYWPAIIYGNDYYRLITYMFLHSGISHLSNNMLVLFVIGNNLERAVGKWRYLFLYFGSGILAGIVSMSYNMIKNTNAVSVGASGAIFGVVGAMAYIVAVNKGRLENISTRQMIMFVFFSLYGGLTSQGIDNAAHIGGLIAGLILAACCYRKHKKKDREGDNIYES
jgi:rhomboid protease GluP